MDKNLILAILYISTFYFLLFLWCFLFLRIKKTTIIETLLLILLLMCSNVVYFNFMYNPTIYMDTVRHTVLPNGIGEHIIRWLTFTINIAINVAVLLVSEFKKKTHTFKYWYVYVVCLIVQIVFYIRIVLPLHNFSSMTWVMG